MIEMGLAEKGDEALFGGLQKLVNILMINRWFGGTFY
jgi:hypothetical protein